MPGASVFLDRKYLGTTPVETTDFTPGNHRLNVSAEGQDMYAETIEVPAGGRDVVVRFKEVRLDEAIDVVHKHGVGSCRGRLAATPAGLAFSGGNAEDAFEAPFASLEPLQVDYLKKNLRVKVKGGKTYNFSADERRRAARVPEGGRGRAEEAVAGEPRRPPAPSLRARGRRPPSRPPAACPAGSRDRG